MRCSVWPCTTVRISLAVIHLTYIMSSRSRICYLHLHPEVYITSRCSSTPNTQSFHRMSKDDTDACIAWWHEHASSEGPYPGQNGRPKCRCNIDHQFIHTVADR
jgi:hypothetical protein